MRLDYAGDDAILVELGDVSARGLHAAHARASSLPGVLRSIPGHSSLYVIFEGRADRHRFEELELVLDRLDDASAPVGVEHRVDIRFDGENLDELLAHVRLTREEFLRRADGLCLTARYIGFRGGFAYLDGWPEEWAMPRRATSRPVAAGSFAIAGTVAAFYPIDTPGGWNILGHTETNLENALQPGDVLTLAIGAPRQGRPIVKRKAVPAERPEVAVNAPLAVWTRRPFDRVAAALARAAVGGADDAEVLECPMAGPRLRFFRDATIAWCPPDLQMTLRRVHAGDEWSSGRIEGGLRGYLAIGEGTRPTEVPARVDARRSDRLRIGAMRGPHEVGRTTVECEVLPQLDRIGIRLRPLEPLGIEAPASMRSIGMQTGTVQLHPNGDLVAMGPDHPLTGGYLQPMTVLSEERWKLAQLRPGERVTFVVYEPNS